jgi:hypothetical protein
VLVVDIRDAREKQRGYALSGWLFSGISGECRIKDVDFDI